MFTCSCFIRKNTPELREKLESLGWEICVCAEFQNAVWLGTLIPFNSIHGIGYDDEEQNVSINCNKFLAETKAIDCGTNEELFLSLASLRDDTDANQWFISDSDPKYWEKVDSDLPSRYMQMNGHKATVEEILKHFK